MLTFSSLFAAALIIFVDRRAVKKLNKRSGDVASPELTEALLEEDVPIRNENDKQCSQSDEVRLTDFRKFGVMFWLLTVSCFVVISFKKNARSHIIERQNTSVYYKA